MRTNSFSVSQTVENKQIQNLCKLCTNKNFPDPDPHLYGPAVYVCTQTFPQIITTVNFYVKCEISKKNNKGKYFLDLNGIRIQFPDLKQDKKKLFLKKIFFFLTGLNRWAKGVIYRLIGPSPAAPTDGGRQPGQQGATHTPGGTPGRFHSRLNKGDQRGLFLPLKQVSQIQILLRTQVSHKKLV